MMPPCTCIVSWLITCTFAKVEFASACGALKTDTMVRSKFIAPLLVPVLICSAAYILFIEMPQESPGPLLSIQQVLAQLFHTTRKQYRLFAQ